ncbi:MAG: HlyD family efflux transporter periplasmic adaptor subunit [Candidatus Omnitrophota bacterium]
MRGKKVKIILAAAVLLGSLAFWQVKARQAKADSGITREIIPVIGNIQNFISTTGVVLPKNRLEIKPPVNGRIDEILVKEGEQVKAGQTLAWMSSTERAALIDAARVQGEEAVKHWQEVYKAIALISPIDGEVIVAKTQPGQTVTTAEAVIVLSDQLIVRAQVDEVDIGKVKPAQEALVSLDAYAGAKIKARVAHIYYESKTVNNVTMYEVDILPENIPSFFRSGMNATVDFVENSKENILVIPLEAVTREKDGAYLLVKQGGQAEVVRRAVQLGISDDKNVEIISGLDRDDVVIVTTKKYMLPQAEKIGTNPFMPARPGRSRNR